ncbi:LysM peptidoglycan-binding domain-containing protein [Thermohalobacter berrensis]|uniref:LysM domain-containing protein n=1 Tax=Thermohalobacter berrensis TaxID=99594 RepID=A0A419T9Q4_9FIRM|nr:LysM domain-containing protein [Thermohalobacter berrensis]RKD34198.1 hypothetical protein BET03_07870 [Thermohalobacter berrensis]
MKYDKEDGSPLSQILENKVYKVKHGDVLWKIADKFKVNLEELIKINNLKNPNLILPGQELKIPVHK